MGEQGKKRMQIVGTTVAHLHTRGGVVPAEEAAFAKSYGTLASVVKQAASDAPEAGAGN